MEKTVDISEVIDRSKVGAFQIGIFLLCGLCLIIDGFDVQAMGFVAPALIKDWHVAGPSLGPVFSAALFGVLVGSLLFSMLADKIGRRPVLIIATLFFGLMTLWAGRANSLNELLTVRFIAGMGLGGIMPNAVALIGEFSPGKSRAAIVMIVANGFNIGAAFGGFLAAWLIPSYGWRSVFYLGAAVPIAIAMLMLFLLPESLQFLALQGKRLDQVKKWLKRIDPAAATDDAARYVVREQKKEGVPAMHLFSEGRGLVTFILWSIFFINLLNLYLLASWLPTVVSAAGYATSTAVLVGTSLQVGGLLASFVMAAFVRRLGIIPVLLIGFFIGAVSIGMIGVVAATLAVLVFVVFMAGWGVVGNQGTLNALAATYYPTYLRSTGVGWCLGIGRIGAIVGPLFAGELMKRNLPTQQLFFTVAGLALIATVLMFSLRWLVKPEAATVAETQVLAH
jgi:AAHS family 4-hydroxybenzoate transporter-like MFS transporter